MLTSIKTYARLPYKSKTNKTPRFSDRTIPNNVHIFDRDAFVLAKHRTLKRYDFCFVLVVWSFYFVANALRKSPSQAKLLVCMEQVKRR